MTKRGLMIAAPRSGSGKSTLTLGLLRALAQRGVAVAAAKSGPDYIDAAFLTAASRRESVNLDAWAMPVPLLRALAGGLDGDLLFVEGAMGLFDGAPGANGGSCADVAAALELPVVLVLDVSGQAQTAAAVALGCAAFDPRVRVAGVVLNKVASERHRRLCAGELEARGLRVLGALPRDSAVALPERHLGLVQAQETAGLETRLDALAVFVAAHCDLDALVALAAPVAEGAPAAALRPPGRRIALARDAAFSFLYPHLLRGWRAAGAEILCFSPLADEPPPEGADMCWLPGGYPELHAERLSGAARFLDGLRLFARTRPVHGECGGFMALGEALVDADGVRRPMAGLLGVETSFAERRLTLGYRRARLCADGPLGPQGAELLGHEFHYATVTVSGADAPFAFARDAYGAPEAPAGARRGLVSGSFFHLISESR